MFAFYLSGNKIHDLGKARTTGHHSRQWRSGCVPNQSWWAALRGSKWRSYLCSDKWSCLVSVFFNALLVFSLSAIIKTLKFLSRSSGSESQTCWEASCGNVTGWSISEPLATHLWPEECKNIHTLVPENITFPHSLTSPSFCPKRETTFIHLFMVNNNFMCIFWTQHVILFICFEFRVCKPLQNNM